MIYIIFDQSYECDGYDDSSNIIKFISTDKEAAIEFFNNHFTNPPESDKWFYHYILVEFEDNYNYIDNDTYKIILSSNNNEE